MTPPSDTRTANRLPGGTWNHPSTTLPPPMLPTPRQGPLGIPTRVLRGTCPSPDTWATLPAEPLGTSPANLSHPDIPSLMVSQPSYYSVLRTSLFFAAHELFVKCSAAYITTCNVNLVSHLWHTMMLLTDVYFESRSSWRFRPFRYLIT